MTATLSNLDEFVVYAKRTTDYEQQLPPQLRAEVFDLARMRSVLDCLGNPHRAIPALHVAGTKGKGSVVRLAEAIARAHGVRTGAFLSPHLVSILERVRLDGMSIDEASFCRAASRVIALERRAKLNPTFFELCFAIATIAYVEAGMALAIHEVGLGGRLDATNVLEPAATAIAAIDYDHMHLLGDTLDAIAREKAGIVKPGVPLVTSPGGPDATEAILAVAARVGAPTWLLGRDISVEREPAAPMSEAFRYEGGPLSGRYRTRALGRHVAANAALALALIERLAERGLVQPSVERAQAALWQCRLPARIEPVGDPPWLILDAAHTPRSGEALAEALDDHFPVRPLHLVTALLRDKRPAAVLGPLAPRLTSAHVTSVAHTPRGRDPDELAAELAGHWPGVEVAVAVPAERALALARERAQGTGGLVVVTGSFYLAGEILPLVRSLPA